MNEAAYVVPIRAGRDTVGLIESQAAEIGVLRDYVASMDAALVAVSADAAALEAAHDMERTAWGERVEALEKANNKLRSPWGLGLFGGWDAIHNQAVLGVGIVFKAVGF